MSMGPLNNVSSLAGTFAQAKGSDVDRAKSESANHRRGVDTVQRAEAAAGIGVTQGDSETSDRDADGRRLWEVTAQPSADAETPTDGTPITLSKDASGDS